MSNDTQEHDVIQWRKGNFDAWIDCSPYPNMQHHYTKVLSRYPTAHFRKIRIIEMPFNPKEQSV